MNLKNKKMKELKSTMLLAAFLFAIFGFTACKGKLKDTDIKAAVEAALKADPDAAGTTVSIEKGVATLSGECKDEMCKTKCAEIVKAVKGVKEVVNNCVVATPAPVVNAEEEVLIKGLADALKDIQGITGSIKEGKIVLTGEIAKAKWAGLKQLLDKLMSKGYDLTGLTIK
jgi:hypothetical protein